MSGRLSRILDGLQSKLNGGSSDAKASGSQTPQGPSNTNGTSSAPHDPPNPYGSSTPYAPLNTHPAPAPYSSPFPQQPPMSQSQYEPGQGPPAPYSGPKRPLYGSSALPGSGSPLPSSCPSTSPPVPAPPVPHVFSIRPSPFSSQAVSIHQAELPNTPPLYFLTTSRWKPQVTMIQADNHATVGEARFSFLGIGIDISLRGQPAYMRRSPIGDSYTVEGPMGMFNWKVVPISGIVSDLVDATGMTVARYKWSGVPGVGESLIELWMPCGPPFIELVLLSLVAARTINGEDMRTGRRKVNSTMGGNTGVGYLFATGGDGGSSGGGGWGGGGGGDGGGGGSGGGGGC